MRARGSLDLLGPSTRAASRRSAAVQTPAEGRARRDDQRRRDARRRRSASPSSCTTSRVFVDAVADACRLTHDTGVAIAGASAVAAAVSAGLDGAGHVEATEVAVAAAELRGAARALGRRGRRRVRIERASRWAVTPSMPRRARSPSSARACSPQESVPAAFGLPRARGRRWLAGLPRGGSGRRRHRHDRRDGRCDGGRDGIGVPRRGDRDRRRASTASSSTSTVVDGLLALRAAADAAARERRQRRRRPARRASGACRASGEDLTATASGISIGGSANTLIAARSARAWPPPTRARTAPVRSATSCAQELDERGHRDRAPAAKATPAGTWRSSNPAASAPSSPPSVPRPARRRALDLRAR